MPKQAERRMASPFTRKGVAEDIHAQPLGQHDGVDAGAAGQGDEKLVLAGAAQQVVAAQQARRAGHHLAEQIVAGVGAQPRVPMAKVVDVEENHAQRALHALHAVGLAEEHGEHRFAVIDAGQAVRLGVSAAASRSISSSRILRWPRETASSAAAGSRARSSAATRSSMTLFGQPVDPFLGHSVRNQDNRKAPSNRPGARRRQQLADLHAGQVDVDHSQRRRMRRGQSGKNRIGGQIDLHLRSVRAEHGFEIRQQGGLGRCEQKGRSRVCEHPGTPPCWMHRRRLEIN